MIISELDKCVAHVMKAFVQMTKWLEGTLGHNECCGAPSPRSIPTLDLCEWQSFRIIELWPAEAQE